VTVIYPDIPLIVLTAPDGAEAAEAIRVGAYDFLGKPAPLEVIAISISRALQQRRLQREVERLRVDGDLVTLEEMERRYVLRVLEVLGGNKTAAARTLGIERKTLYRKLESWGENDPESSPGALR
jgi:DNA-binding NtrC family response regulator